MQRSSLQEYPKPTVFIVDDDEGIRDLLAILIEREGYAVETFDSAESFMRGHVAQTHRCLLTDVDLPDMSGLELLEQLADKHNLPVIVMSGRADQLTSVKAMNGGAIDYFRKPFDGIELIARIKQVMKKELQKMVSLS